MTEFWEQIIIILIGNGCFAAIFSFLGKMYFEKSEKRHQESMAKNNQFQQISMETYQNLFKKKLDVYQELAELKYDASLRLSESECTETLDNHMEVNRENDIKFYKIEKILEKIKKNRLYITPSLSDSVLKFERSARDDIEAHREATDYNLSENHYSFFDALENDELFAEKMRNQHSDIIEEILKKIDNDLNDISKIIHHD